MPTLCNLIFGHGSVSPLRSFYLARIVSRCSSASCLFRFTYVILPNPFQGIPTDEYSLPNNSHYLPTFVRTTLFLHTHIIINLILSFRGSDIDRRCLLLGFRD